MLRKCTTFVLILALLNLTSCYSHKIVKSSQEAQTYELSKYDSVTIKSIDGKSETLKRCYITGNSFIGFDKHDQEKTIPVDQIAEFKLNKFSTWKTVGLSVGLLLTVAAVAFSIWAAAFSARMSKDDS